MNKKQPFTPSSILKYALQGCLFAVFATVGIILFYTAPDTFDHLKQFNWTTKCWLLLLILGAWLCNGGRVYLLSHSLGYRLRYIQSLAISLSSEFGIAATPAGMGGAAIRLTLLKKAGVPVAHGTSMLAIDVALDSLFFFLLVPFAVMSIVRNPKILALLGGFETTHWMEIIIALVCIVGLVAWFVRSRWCHQKILQWPQAKSLKKYKIPARMRWMRWKAVHGWHQMAGGFVHILHLKRGAMFLTFILASIQWTCRYSILPLLLYGLSLPCDPILLFLLQGFLFTGSLVLVLPGGGGGVELSAAVILRQIIPPYLVGVVVLLWRFFTYHLYLLGGGGMFLWTCTRLKTLFPEAEPEEEITFDKENNT